VLGTATKKGVRKSEATGSKCCSVTKFALVEVRQRCDVLAVELQQRVAVGRGTPGLVDGDEATATGLVVDHHALVPLAAQLVGDQAQHGIGAAARGEGRDDASRACSGSPRRPAPWQCPAKCGGQAGNEMASVHGSCLRLCV
jgi:hypothetical protein